MANQPPIQLQWALDRSANGALTLLQDIIGAATTDNVSPLALKTANEFGMTLPVNIYTRLKIEQLARQSQSLPILSLKLLVGYRKGDCVDWLSRQEGGSRFLCLAVALCSLKNLISAARIVEDLVKDKTSEFQLPSTSQYLDLLKVLKRKLALSDFTDNVLGWYTYSLPPSKEVVSSVPWNTPSTQDIGRLVIALGECARLGDKCYVYIQCGSRYFPWTMAFVKWFMKHPPQVWKQDRLIISSADDSITIVVRDDHLWKIEITKSIKSFRQLQKHLSPFYQGQVFEGLVSITDWMFYRIHVYERSLKVKFFFPWWQKTLSVLIKYLPEKILFDQDLDSITSTFQERHTTNRASPFFGYEARLQMIQGFLPKICLTDDSLDLELWKAQTERMCGGCRWCDRAQMGDLSKLASSSPCPKAFVGELAADILALSLFSRTSSGNVLPKVVFRTSDSDREKYCNNEYRDSLRLHSLQGATYLDADKWCSLITYGWWDLVTEHVNYLHCRSEDLFHHTLEILGHEKLPVAEAMSHYTDLIISEQYGQVIYPAILESQALRQKHYLELHCFRGILQWNGVQVTHVCNTSRAGHSHGSGEGIPLGDTERLDKGHSPRSLGNVRIDYTIGQLDDYINIINIFTKHEDNLPRMPPWTIIRGLGKIIFAPTCPHPPSSAVGEDLKLDVRIVRGDLRRFHLPPDHYVLCDIHGNDPTRLMNIAYLFAIKQPAVLHYRGCLRCALELAAAAGVGYVIC